MCIYIDIGPASFCSYVFEGFSCNAITRFFSFLIRVIKLKKNPTGLWLFFWCLCKFVSCNVVYKIFSWQQLLCSNILIIIEIQRKKRQLNTIEDKTCTCGIRTWLLVGTSNHKYWPQPKKIAFTYPTSQSSAWIQTNFIMYLYRWSTNSVTILSGKMSLMYNR